MCSGFKCKGLGFSPACTEQPVPHATASCEEYGDNIPVQCYIALPPVAWVYYAKGVSTKLVKQAKGLDPLYKFICIGSDLRNWMPDTGACEDILHILSNKEQCSRRTTHSRRLMHNRTLPPI